MMFKPSYKNTQSLGTREPATYFTPHGLALNRWGQGPGPCSVVKLLTACSLWLMFFLRPEAPRQCVFLGLMLQHARIWVHTARRPGAPVLWAPDRETSCIRVFVPWSEEQGFPQCWNCSLHCAWCRVPSRMGLCFSLFS